MNPAGMFLVYFDNSIILVKALVELHGGWVALESEPGSGAVFICHLPEHAYGGAAVPELQLGAA